MLTERLRQWLAWVAPTRVHLAAHLAVVLAALVACFVPLFGLLGYESAALFGALAGVAAAFLTLHGRQAGLYQAPIARRRLTSPTADFLRLYARHLTLLVVPALVLTLNAVRVPNCDFALGVGFWLTIPVVSVLVGQAIGWVVATVVPTSRRWQVGLAAAAILASAGTLLWQIGFQPPIVGHQLFIGYFSGSIYDEALSLPASLLWYRLLNVAAVAVVLLAIEALWRWRRDLSVRWVVVLLVAATAALGALWVERRELGIDRDRAFIQAELGGRIETEHFVIHYPLNDFFVDRRELLAQDHEYRYAEMRAFFETDPASAAKIHSYVYPDRETKGDLMGARRTLVAKLWLKEMHILWRDYGDHMLAHELAHIFTEPFGSGPLRLSMQNGIGVNMGMVEGVATAADWPADELTPHEAAAAMRRLELAPSIDRLVGASGFWTQAHGLAYTLVGSFVRYLIDTYGIAPFKAAYATGDFAAAYGKPAGELVDEWERFVDAIALADRELDLARYLYDRPSIFEKVCARTVAELRRKADLAMSQGNVGRGQALYEQIIGFDPANVRYRLMYAQALMAGEELDAALGQVEGLLGGEAARPLGPVERAKLLELAGDLAWKLDRPDEADQAYRECLEAGLPADVRRLVEVKQTSVNRGQPARQLAFAYLLGDVDPYVALYYPMTWADRAGDDPLAAYLVARRLWATMQWAEALEHLETAAGLDSELLVLETRRMQAQSLYFLGRLDAAEPIFEALAQADRSSYATEAAEWLRRIAWRRASGT